MWKKERENGKKKQNREKEQDPDACYEPHDSSNLTGQISRC